MRRYVKRSPRTRILKLPVDRWQGRTFKTANGDELEVLWDGSAKHVTLCGEWPSGEPQHQRTIGHPVVTP
jgi:hypothetical protein